MKIYFGDVNEVLETKQITPENEEDESNHLIATACTPFQEATRTMSVSYGFENV